MIPAIGHLLKVISPPNWMRLLIDGEQVIVSDYSDPAMIPWQQAGVG
ncbi:MAG: hypothetical protein R2865_01690 [Deinococcales bacterium]